MTDNKPSEPPRKAETELICVVCPRGCRIILTWSLEDGRLLDVEGHCCPLGRNWAEQEFRSPMRTLCTSVGVIGGSAPLVSVRTAGSIPLSSFEVIMRQVREIWVGAPVQAGCVVARVKSSDSPGDEVDLVTTSSVAAR